MKKTKLFLTILLVLALVPGIALGQQNRGEDGNKSVDSEEALEVEEVESQKAGDNGQGSQDSDSGEQKGVHEPGTGLQEPELLEDLDKEESVEKSEDQPVNKENGQGNGQINEDGQRDGQGEMNAQDLEDSEESVKAGPSERALERRSKVASAVQEMLKVAERNEGVGQQIRQVAQEQNQIHEEAGEALMKAESRGGFAKFLVGPDNAQLEKAEKKLEEQKEKIEELNSIKAQLEDEEEVSFFDEQIEKMEEVAENVAEEIKEERKGFSLFGWVSKMFGGNRE